MLYLRIDQTCTLHGNSTKKALNFSRQISNDSVFDPRRNFAKENFKQARLSTSTFSRPSKWSSLRLTTSCLDVMSGFLTCKMRLSAVLAKNEAAQLPQARYDPKNNKYGVKFPPTDNQCSPVGSLKPNFNSGLTSHPSLRLLFLHASLEMPEL